MPSRSAIILTLTLSPLILCGATSGGCNAPSGSIGPSGTEVAFVAVGVGAVVAIAIIVPIEANKAHHTLNGCVYSTPTGLELRTSDQKVYALSGATAKVAPGTIVRLHGDRQKHDKNAPGDQVFLVKEIKKTSGPCTVLNASTPTPPSTPTASPVAPAKSNP